MIKRSVVVGVEPTAAELAEAFWEMRDIDQAKFFNELACYYDIESRIQDVAEADSLSKEGRQLMRKIGEAASDGQ